MPAARAFVRNQSGLQGKGMGILKPEHLIDAVVREIEGDSGV